jgi:hypothetical protein
MVHNLKLAKLFWSITTALTFLAALGGVLFRGMYVGLFPADFLPGAFPQDVLTFFVCIFLFVMIASTGEHDIRKQVIIVGLLGSFFYLYGIFTMERVYNWFYLVYMAIFAASFWSVVYSLAGFKSAAFTGLRLGDGIRKATAIASIVIAVLFTFLWIMALLPLMKNHDRIDFMYSIFILDLCFVMPAFFMTAVMALRKMPLGILMGPAIMILGFFVIFPLGLNELAKPAAGLAMNTGSMLISFVFSVIMLALAALQLKSIHFE